MKGSYDVNRAKEGDKNNTRELLHKRGCKDVSVVSITILGRNADEEEAKP